VLCCGISPGILCIIQATRFALHAQSVHLNSSMLHPLKPHEIAPSARLTRSERMQITRIRVDLAQNGIRPQRWELEALVRGATVNYDGKKFTYPVADEWPGFSTVMEWT
jgi:hypothetical protein